MTPALSMAILIGILLVLIGVLVGWWLLVPAILLDLAGFTWIALSEMKERSR